ncbi:hypothetical protein ACI3KS_07600, partial [Microbacterium sp. ZW T5_45]|uniref:hypothetical protein n=1 Tax=Microbacterium sp. ZW T5_45 TaxID=3378080 RepID=UPI003854923E
MPARGSKSAQARTQAERARLHEARKAWREGQIRRRVRDNVVAGIAGGIIVVAAITSQVVHAQVTAPEPEPTPAVEPTGTSVDPSEAPAESTDAPVDPATTEEPAPESTPAD